MGRAPMEVLSGWVPTSEIEEEAVERDLPRKSREAGERKGITVWERSPI